MVKNVKEQRAIYAEMDRFIMYAGLVFGPLVVLILPKIGVHYGPIMMLMCVTAGLFVGHFFKESVSTKILNLLKLSYFGALRTAILVFSFVAILSGYVASEVSYELGQVIGILFAVSLLVFGFYAKSTSRDPS